MILLFLNTTLGGSWNIIGGYAGQYSIGHSAFFGFGAYTTMILLTRNAIPPWLGVWGGVALGVGVAWIVGSICFRLRGPYFTLASIAVAEIFYICANNMTWLTNGGQGILATDIPPLQIGSWLVTDFSTKVPYYYLGLGLAALSIAVSWAVGRSKMGFYLKAIREDQDAADSLGISLPYYKNAALLLSAAFAAMAGGFSALYVGFIDPPTVLSIDISISIVLICIIGGVGTLIGPVIGAVVVVALSESLRANVIPQLLFSSGLVSRDSGVGSFLGEQIAHAHILIYGIIVVFVILYMPDGVLGAIRKALRRRQPIAQGAG